MNYLCKRTEDENGALTGYSELKKVLTTGYIRIPKGYDLLIGEDHRYAKVEFVDGKWCVCADPDAETAATAASQAKADRKQRLADAVSSLEADLTAATTIAGVKAVIKPLLQDLLEDLYS